MKTRPSEIAQAVACWFSVHPEDGVIIDHDSEPARIGTAVHELLAAMVSGAEIDMENVCARHRVDISDVGPLYGAGRNMFREPDEIGDTLEGYFPDPLVEYRVEGRLADGYECSGTCDVVSISDDALNVLDWKTGRVEGNWFDQIAVYAFLALQQARRDREDYAPPRITSSIALVREKETITYSFTPETLSQAIASIVSDLRNAEGKYRVGEHCRNCSYKPTCKAWGERQTALIQQFGIAHEGKADLVQQAALHYDQLRAIEKQIAAVKKLVRDHIIENGENVRIDDDTVLTAVSQKRRSYLPSPVYSYLVEQGVGTDGILRSFEPKRQAVLNALYEANPDMKKKDVREEFDAAMEAADGVVESRHYKLQRRKQ